LDKKEAVRDARRVSLLWKYPAGVRGRKAPGSTGEGIGNAAAAKLAKPAQTRVKAAPLRLDGAE